MKMECLYNMNSSGNRRVIYFDCLDCANKGLLESDDCLQSISKVLSDKAGVDELQFRKREYTLSYGRSQVEKLFEFTDLGRDLLGRRVWTGIVDCERSHSSWRIFIRDLLVKDIWSDPIRAYEMLVAVSNQYRRLHVRKRFKPGCCKVYMRLLDDIKTRFENTRLIGEFLQGLEFYEIFQPTIQPSFITSRLSLAVPCEAKLADFYRVEGSEVGIYDLNGVDRLYHIKPPEFYLSPERVTLLVNLRQQVIRENVFEIIPPIEARGYFKRIGLELLRNVDGRLSVSELEDMSEIFARYTAGYGLLEILFRDEHIYDVYIDSPAGETPVYVDHDRFGVCTTNLYLSEDDLERISSKFRSIGGRPFDEANPIMDMELRDMGVRVTGIREPSTFDGIAYSFRKRREKPWTLQRFVYDGMMSAKAAALLSLIVSGQRSILVTGARGSGKTSLLCALIAEIRQSDRIVLMEDTPELPVDFLRGLGWKIEHLRNQPVISRNNRESYELSPEENLRAALRLGESVLILGEVRGPEAKALFEAMRVGAAGNAVFGTIHGSSPYDTWDRITNDLNVPSTSFKAVDVVVSLGYRENRENSTRCRYLRSITEVGGDWTVNPQTEGGFSDMMFFDSVTGSEVYNLKDSVVLGEISVRKNMSPGECKANLKLRERIMESIVRRSRGEGLTELLEINHVLDANREYVRLMNEHTLNAGNLDYSRLYRDWNRWFKKYTGNLRKLL